MEMKNRISQLIMKIAKEISRYDDDDLLMLLRGELDIEIKLIKRAPKEAQPRTRTQDHDPIFSSMVEEMKFMKSREEGSAFLQNKGLSKKDLYRMAKHIDISVTNRDSKSVLEDKIIEAIIGFRLRSKAIQGE